ncbi:MAG TPA: CaiB/BaiF CoA-transferase family protein [Candidatus Binatia bacterium]|nr:CaiB/BaiF CoA-transferase family protein [Candidatus Binatia bacterium]
MPFRVLKDVTVVECSTFVTGPYAALLLADLGARVIKIESPPDGDPYRYFAPDAYFSFNFAHLNRNKESLALDLKSSEGKEICLELLKRADVFVENFRPGTAERLGLGYDALRKINLRLVYCSISAFGRSGPYANKPGFDTLGQAASGLLSLLTDPDDPKVMGMAVSDYVTGLSAGYGILGALLGREKSGDGCKVETSLLQATLSFIGETAAGYLRTGSVPNRMARVKNAHAFAFVCKDKLPIAIHCSVPEKFWLALLKAADRMDLANDQRFSTRDARRQNYEALESTLAPVFLERSRAEWLQRLEVNDVPVFPLYNVAEVLADPQVRHLDLVEESSHPRAGKLQFVGGPVRYDGLAKEKSTPPPLVGEHTESILRELGYEQSAIDKLARTGSVRVVQI